MSLKILMLKAGISQKQLAKKLGVTQQLISKWVNGVCQPQLCMLNKMAEALSTELSEIIACF